MIWKTSDILDQAAQFFGRNEDPTEQKQELQFLAISGNQTFGLV